MLKALIRKQFQECFRSYFVDPKTGKARSAKSIVGRFVLFGVLMLYLAAVFFGMSFLCGGMLQEGLGWLFFAVMGIVAILLGTFGSVFNTFASLYLAKDNDLLLAMPIPSYAILTSRMTLVYALALLYSGIVWLPAILYYWISGTATVGGVIFGILLLFLIPLFVTVLTCALGWVVALISVKVKNRGILTALMAAAFLGVYFYLSTRLSGLVDTVIANSGRIAEGMKKWGSLIYHMGRGAEGSALSMLIFTVVTLALFAACILILSRSFRAIVSRSSGNEKKSTKKAQIREGGLSSALFRKELKRFTASPTYMLNNGLGILILPVLSILALVKKGDLSGFIDALTESAPGVLELLPIFIAVGICIVTGMDSITTPSISLEGKNLWILKSLPVTGAQVLRTKVKLHVVLNSVPAVIAAVLLGVTFGFGWERIFLCALVCCTFVWFTGEVDLVLGLKHPNFTWTSETMPIKQSGTVLAAIMIGFGLSVVMAGVGYLLRNVLETEAILSMWAVLLALGARYVDHWLCTKGDKLFAEL